MLGTGGVSHEQASVLFISWVECQPDQAAFAEFGNSTGNVQEGPFQQDSVTNDPNAPDQLRGKQPSRPVTGGCDVRETSQAGSHGVQAGNGTREESSHEQQVQESGKRDLWFRQ